MADDRERELFEACAENNGLSIRRVSGIPECQAYENAVTADCWRCWQARADIARREAGAWQPIESAPCDEVLLLWTGNYQHTGMFDSGDTCWRAIADDVELVPRPTHWMPLPAPPAALAATP